MRIFPSNSKTHFSSRPSSYPLHSGRPFRMSARSFVGNPQLSSSLRNAIDCRGDWNNTIPIVYCEEYNIRALGLEKLHPFDSCKFHKIVSILENSGLLKRSMLPAPTAATDDNLMEIHSRKYIDDVHKSKLYICQIVEMAVFFLIPNFLLVRYLVTPMRYHVNGTVLAMAMAIERGWAINLGGGAHHARRDHGEGWCFFSDVYIAIQKIRTATERRISKVLYIDCDVHQGNGVERDKLTLKDEDIFILDVYNADIWPNDREAKKAIDIGVELRSGDGDDVYISRLRSALDQAKAAFEADVVVYNAGTDILMGDPLGDMSVTSDGVLKRDAMVFQHAMDVNAPIVMTLSGGYSKQTHKVIAESILNLNKQFNLISTM